MSCKCETGKGDDKLKNAFLWINTPAAVIGGTLPSNPTGREIRLKGGVYDTVKNAYTIASGPDGGDYRPVGIPGQGPNSGYAAFTNRTWQWAETIPFVYVGPPGTVVIKAGSPGYTPQQTTPQNQPVTVSDPNVYTDVSVPMPWQPGYPGNATTGTTPLYSDGSGMPPLDFSSIYAGLTVPPTIDLFGSGGIDMNAIFAGIKLPAPIDFGSMFSNYGPVSQPQGLLGALYVPRESFDINDIDYSLMGDGYLYGVHPTGWTARASLGFLPEMFAMQGIQRLVGSQGLRGGSFNMYPLADGNFMGPIADIVKTIMPPLAELIKRSDDDDSRTAKDKIKSIKSKASDGDEKAQLQSDLIDILRKMKLDDEVLQEVSESLSKKRKKSEK